MTAIVGFLCSDGVVVAADSMLTPNMGGTAVGHHKGKKLHELLGRFVTGYAGDQGQATRFRLTVEESSASFDANAHPMDFLEAISGKFVDRLTNSRENEVAVETMLAFGCAQGACLCVFDNRAQPVLLDYNHFYAALGIGKMAADPFLRFLVDIFCVDGPPQINEAIFLSLWTLQHVIDTSPGGVAGPIAIGVLRLAEGEWAARVLSGEELQEHRQAVDSATDALRDWRKGLGSGTITVVPPVPPPIPPIAGS